MTLDFIPTCQQGVLLLSVLKKEANICIDFLINRHNCFFMSILLSHPTGNANVRAVAEGFARANILYRYSTSVATFPDNLSYKIGRVPFLKEIRRRSYNPILHQYTETYPFYELGRIMSSKLGLDSLTKHEKGIFSVDSVYRHMDKIVAANLLQAQRNGVTGVYAYEDGAMETFRRAKELGLTCFYDLPTGYWKSSRELLSKDKEKYPDWKNTFTGFRDSQEKLSRKDEELLLADVIFVASKFTANTLNLYSDKLPPVEIIPYGFPPVNGERIYTSFEGGRTLKLLFVGKLSQQKGLADVFDALREFGNHVELTLIGSKGDSVALDKELSCHNYLGTKSHQEVLEIMSEHDILLFPSLFDGFGMVITEAMSQGTPVIASNRSAGPDLITHGQNGWLMKAGDVQSLQSILQELLINPSIIENIGRQAMITARQRPWSVYASHLIETMTKYVEK